MKRYILTLVAAMVMLSVSAMSLSKAREQALFLTDKMAYELNLTPDQYNAAYEINLDYILNIERSTDLFGIYWNRRNTEMSFVLSAAQYNAYLHSEYFYRPITWIRNEFRFVIYDRYPKNHFYRPAPPGYQTYRGGNRYYDNSPYSGRNFDSRPPKPGNNTHGGHKPGGTRPGNDKPGGNVTPPSTGHSGHSTGGQVGSGRTGAGKDRPGGTMTKKEAVKQGKDNMGNHRH